MRRTTAPPALANMGGPLVVPAMAGFAVFLWQNRHRDIAVLFPPPGLIEALPEGTEILESSASQLVVSGAPGLSATLYAAGATIVLAADRGGCKARALP